MLIIAVTGGIGVGKSTVAELFKQKGVPIIDTDEIARQLVQPGSPILDQLIKSFGNEYLDADGHLKRKALGQLIFTNTAAREKLETLLHPAIHAELTAKLKSLAAPYCLLLIPLLARAKQPYPHDRVLVIDVPQNVQIQRTAGRDSSDPNLIKQIIAAQTPHDQLIRLADDILDNSGTLADLQVQVDKLHNRYLALAKELTEST
jgi:dephospho-CoA kinase